jgi:hypothetical protein
LDRPGLRILALSGALLTLIPEELARHFGSIFCFFLLMFLTLKDWEYFPPPHFESMTVLVIMVILNLSLPNSPQEESKKAESAKSRNTERFFLFTVTPRIMFFASVAD